MTSTFRHVTTSRRTGLQSQSVRRGALRWLRNGGPAAIGFALPAVLVFGLFNWYPIVSAVRMSFQSTNLVTDPIWVGLANFDYVLGDPLFWIAMRNSFVFTALALVIAFPLPIILATLISEIRRRRSLYAVLAYLPVVVPPVVAILLWRAMYQPDETGVINSLLGIVGIEPLGWLSDRDLAMPAIVIEFVWASIGANVIIYIAALALVPPELYEAAELDGASVLKRAWHVTLPQLRGVMLVMFLLTMLGTLQVFAEPYIFTGGGPENATVSILLLIYRYAFANNDFGAATAASVILALVLAAISTAYALATRRWSTS